MQTTTRKQAALIDLLACHAHANEQVFAWSARAVDLRKAGKEIQARAAERKMRDWLRQARNIESGSRPVVACSRARPRSPCESHL
jgi:hypothetical protein